MPVLLTPDGRTDSRWKSGFFRSGSGGADASETLALNDAQKEKECIMRALEETGGNRKEAARLLGISRSTLYEKLRKYGFQ